METRHSSTSQSSRAVATSSSNTKRSSKRNNGSQRRENEPIASTSTSSQSRSQPVRRRLMQDMESEESSSETSVTNEESMDSTTFKEQYAALTTTAKKLGKDVESGAKEKENEIENNVCEGNNLAGGIGCSPSKAITALLHTAAISETIHVRAKKCGTTCQYFAVPKYLEIIKNLCGGQNGYNRDAAKTLLGEEVAVTSFCSFGMMTFMGAVDPSTQLEELAPVVKVRKMLGRTKFEETLTRHPIVNTQDAARTGKKVTSLDVSMRNAARVQDLCEKKHATAVPLVQYGLNDAEADPKTFLKNIFDIAVAARDGCAVVTNPDVEKGPDSHKQTRTGYSRKTNGKIVIQGTKPPADEAESFEVNRNQHIMSFNAKDIKKMLALAQTESSSQQ